MLKTKDVNDVELFVAKKELIIANNAEDSETTSKSTGPTIARLQSKKPTRDTLERIIAKIKRI